MAPNIAPYKELPLLKRRRLRNRNIALLCTTSAAAYYYQSNFDKIPQHTSELSGKEWMEELLNGHELRIKNNLGISQEGFRVLEGRLVGWERQL